MIREFLMRSFLASVFAVLCILSAQVRAESLPIVATSVKPVSMVVKAIAGDKVKIEQIVSNSASPHDFALRPSDIKKLLKADLVVWVGESLEPFLEKPIANSQHAKSAIEWMLLVEGEADHDEEPQGHQVKVSSSHQHGDHHHEGLDPHLWLDLENAIILARSVTQRLSDMKPTLASYFQHNLNLFEQTLKQTDKDNRSLLAEVGKFNYVVFHDAYGYFESHYGLKHLANISLSPERKPGAKKIVSIRKLMKEHKVACIFSEVQFNPAIVNALVEGTQVKAIELDPLGTNIELNAEAYPVFLKQMSHQFSQCAI